MQDQPNPERSPLVILENLLERLALATSVADMNIAAGIALNELDGTSEPN